MLTKPGKEKNITSHPYFRLKYGTVDSNELTAIYLEVQSWVRPINDEIDFNRSVTYLKKVAYNSVNNNLNRDTFKNNFIVDLDLRTSGMSVNKRTFMCIEVTLFLQKKIKFKSDETHQILSELLKNITADLEQNNKFTFKQKKK